MPSFMQPSKASCSVSAAAAWQALRICRPFQRVDLALVLGKMVLCEFQDLVFIDLHCATLTLRELFEIGGPDLHRLVKFKRWIVKLCMNPRHKCFVQDANTVGSQEQNTSVELKDAQED